VLINGSGTEGSVNLPLRRKHLKHPVTSVPVTTFGQINENRSEHPGASRPTRYSTSRFRRIARFCHAAWYRPARSNSLFARKF